MTVQTLIDIIQSGAILVLSLALLHRSRTPSGSNPPEEEPAPVAKKVVRKKVVRRPK